MTCIKPVPAGQAALPCKHIPEWHVRLLRYHGRYSSRARDAARERPEIEQPGVESTRRPRRGAKLAWVHYRGTVERSSPVVVLTPGG